MLYSVHSSLKDEVKHQGGKIPWVCLKFFLMRIKNWTAVYECFKTHTFVLIKFELTFKCYLSSLSLCYFFLSFFFFSVIVIQWPSHQSPCYLLLCQASFIWTSLPDATPRKYFQCISYTRYNLTLLDFELKANWFQKMLFSFWTGSTHHSGRKKGRQLSRVGGGVGSAASTLTSEIKMHYSS